MIAPGPLTLAVSFSRNKPFHSVLHVGTNFVLKPQLGARKRKPDKTNVLLFLTTPAVPLLFCTMILLFLCSNVCNSFFHSPMSSLSLSSCFFFCYNYYCNKHLWNCAIRVSFVSLLWRKGWGGWSYRGHYKGEQIGMGGFGSFFVLQMSLRLLYFCLTWNVVKPCRKIMHVYLGLLERFVGKTAWVVWMECAGQFLYSLLFHTRRWQLCGVSWCGK